MMKQDCDLYTAELSLPRKTGRKAIYSNTAERVSAHRARSGKKSLTVLISPDVISKLDAFMNNEKFGKRDETKSQVVERALQQFFRKR
jgi:hypothetical protein